MGAEMMDAVSVEQAWRSLAVAVPDEGEVVLLQMRPERRPITDRVVLATRRGAAVLLPGGVRESIRGLIARRSAGRAVPVWCRVPGPLDVDGVEQRLRIRRLEGELRQARQALAEAAASERPGVVVEQVEEPVAGLLTMDARTCNVQRELRFRRFEGGPWVLQRRVAVHNSAGVRRIDWREVEECGVGPFPRVSEHGLELCAMEWARIRFEEVSGR